MKKAYLLTITLKIMSSNL